jgi:hypothetical protein
VQVRVLTSNARLEKQIPQRYEGECVIGRLIPKEKACFKRIKDIESFKF